MILEESYAQALLKSVKGKTKNEVEEIINRFFALILKKGHQGILLRIAKALERVQSEGALKNTVKIFVKEEGREVLPKEFVSLFFVSGGKDEESLIYEACEDNTIIGGYVAKGKGLRVDASYKTSLLSLYSKIKA